MIYRCVLGPPLLQVYLVWPDHWIVLSLLSLLSLTYTIFKLYLQTSGDSIYSDQMAAAVILCCYNVIIILECVFAVSGVGVCVSKCCGPFTLTSLFIPQAATHSVIIYEAIAKVVIFYVHLYIKRMTFPFFVSQYHIQFTLGLYLCSPSSTKTKGILVPLFKVRIVLL